MIIVTGATGALNGATVDHLLTLVPAEQVTVTARDVSRVQHFAERGVGVRRADYAEPASLPAAFEGADQLLLVSSNTPGDTLPLHRAAVEAAVQASVGRILYTSHQGAAADSPFVPARVHAATEQLLAGAGLPWTSLRNGFYLHSLDWLLGPWRTSGVVSVPADGPVSWTDRGDEAEAAAVILAAGGGYDGPVTLTAAAAPTFDDVAATAGEVAGRPVRFEVIDEQDWVARQVDAGQPEPMARFLLGMFQAAQGGYFAGTDPLLSTLLGREPRSVRDHLEQQDAGAPRG